MSARDSQAIECVTIIIDYNWLYQNLKHEGALRTKNHLILHEIGHLALHWDALRIADSPEKVMARSATPQQEAEAWWFVYSLLGYLVARCAYVNKEDGGNADDQLWNYPFR